MSSISIPIPIYLAYDERMQLHINTNDKNNDYCVEIPERLACIYNRLIELEHRLFTPIFQRLNCPLVDKETVLLTHSESYFEALWKTSNLYMNMNMNMSSSRDTYKLWSDADANDMYLCEDSFQAASLACGGVVECVNAVTTTTYNTTTTTTTSTTDSTNSSTDSTIRRGLALVRPPGHHACASQAMGFCFFNSVVVAAKHAIHTQKANRVLILDWDIHHGNGTQDLTYDDPNILYISLHRYTTKTKQNKKTESFYPGTGHPNEVGVPNHNHKDKDKHSKHKHKHTKNAYGKNLNIAFTKPKMGNVEYAAAFSQLILPIIAMYNPNLVLISCGLDAAKGDLLGDCCITSNGYHALTKSVLETVGSETPVVVALEGGYNVEVISCCMEAVVLALLDIDYDVDCGTMNMNRDGDTDGTSVSNDIVVEKDATDDVGNTDAAAAAVVDDDDDAVNTPDIVEEENVPMPLSLPQDRSSINSMTFNKTHDDSKRTVQNLEKGKQALAHFWTYNTNDNVNDNQKNDDNNNNKNEDEVTRQKVQKKMDIQSAAIHDINTSIQAMKHTNVWTHDKITFSEIDLNIVFDKDKDRKNGALRRIMTRSSTAKQKKKQNALKQKHQDSSSNTNTRTSTSTSNNHTTTPKKKHNDDKNGDKNGDNSIDDLDQAMNSISLS